MHFDVFISYSSKDKTVADAVCARLEAAGIRCWIAPRDVLAGTSYGEAIIEAIHSAKIMVLVFSSSANASGHIPKEVERAVSNGLTILPFRIENVPPGKSLDYFIGSVHWLDAMTPPMDKHLDDLAETVKKLLPARSEKSETPVIAPPPATHVPRPAAVPTVAPPIASEPQRTAPPLIAQAGTTAMKKAWIALAALAVLALVVLIVVLIPKPPAPAVSAPTTANTPASAANAPPEQQSPDAKNVPALVRERLNEVQKLMSVEPIVGCYQWFNNAPVFIHANRTIVGGPFTGRWEPLTISPTERTYKFTWPEAVDTVTIAVDQQSLAGGNQYGYPTSGTRMSGSSGLVGVWRWPNGVPVTVLGNGTFTAATFHGRWKAVDAARGVYTLTWPKPVDNVTLSADATHISGSNQYGIAISGVRTAPCAEK